MAARRCSSSGKALRDCAGGRGFAPDRTAGARGKECPMQPWVWIIAAVVVIVLAALAWWYAQQQKTRQLRQRFGSEYDHSVQKLGDEHRAQEELQRREDRVEGFQLRPLSPDDRQRFGESWQAVQAKFVDDPAGATHEADTLVTEAMRVRGDRKSVV